MIKFFFKPKSLFGEINKIKEPINFVPTMGNLHLGHQELIKKAKKREGKCLVSIFINPLQFSEKKDFEKYPKTLETDLDLMKKLNVDYIFLPEKDFLDKTTTISLTADRFTGLLCGLDRARHFDGVMTIISKLLNLIRPDFIFLGEKDFQQLFIIKKLISELYFKTKVISVKTIREKDGLAYSSRNKLLSTKEREIAKEIFICLLIIKEEIKENKFTDARFFYFKERLINLGFKKVNYLEIRDEESLSEIREVSKNSRLFISVMLGQVRLIDNIKVGRIRKIGSKYKNCN